MHPLPLLWSKSYNRKCGGGHFLQLFIFSCFLLSIPLSLSDLKKEDQEKGNICPMGNLQGSFKDFLLTVPPDEFPQVEDASIRVLEPTSIFLNPGRALHQEIFLAVFSYLLQTTAISIMVCSFPIAQIPHY